MRCLVTGASGFIGAAFVRKLLHHGHDVTVLLRPSTTPWRLGDSLDSVRIVYGDLKNLDALDAELRRNPIDAVCHLAWLGATAEHRNSPEQIATNAVGTLKLWEIARSAGCKSWIGLGSQAEYGPHGGVLEDSVHPVPVTAYGVAKLATGMMTSKMSELAGIRHVWVRMVSAYGPADDENRMIPSVIRALLAGGRPALTPGEQLWDFLYIDDVVSALYSLLEKGVDGVYNLGSGSVTTIRAAVEQIRDLIDPSLPIGFGDVPYRPDQVMHQLADIRKLERATGWRPQVSLTEGLKQTVRWHQTSRARDSERMPHPRTRS